MYIIIDKDNTIQDIATRKQNLSRGYQFDDYTLHELSNTTTAHIGDQYIDDRVIPNKENQTARKKESIENEIIDLEMKREACQRLNLNTIESMLSSKIQTLQNDLASLSNP